MPSLASMYIHDKILREGTNDKPNWMIRFTVRVNNLDET